MKVTVKVYMDGTEVLSKVLNPGVYRVGRSEFCDLVLNHQTISRSHLELRVTENAAYMTNMSSGGKVRVNGNSAETAELGNGDEIKLGPFRMVVFHGESDSPAEPANNEVDGGGFEDPMNNGMEDGGGMGDNPEENDGGFGMDGGMGDVPAMEEDGGLGGDMGDAPGFDEGGVGVMEEGQDIMGGLQDPFAGGGDMVPAGEPAPDGTAVGNAETQLEIKPIVAKLVFTTGPREGEELFIETFEVTLGRSKRADIYIDDEKLSRFHAKITRVGLGYRLIDQDSRNGTYVNGMRVLEHPLNSFDEIELGASKIRFLIHDVMASEMQRERGGSQLAVDQPYMEGSAALALDQTKSIQMDALSRDVMLELQHPGAAPPMTPTDFSYGEEPELPAARGKKTKILAGAILALLVLFILLPSDPPAPTTPVETVQEDPLKDIELPSNLPKEFATLTEEQQRQMEGFYQAAIQSSVNGQYEDAVEYLRKIHSVLPFYKDSREALDKAIKQLKEKQIAEAQRRAKEDEKQDLAIYLEEGMDYLKAGDFERAAEAFNSAIVIDPNNETAVNGLKAAQAKVKNLDEIPKESDSEQEKRKLVAELFQRAVTAFTNKSYDEAVRTAEQIRKIELKGDTQYLNEAKQIIDRAKMLQKEEFEPFLIQAKEKYAEGDYNASRDLCEEMLKRDESYDEAKECLKKARKQLNRLAKEAYTYGYILESMNRIEEAKQYWNRARNYVRQGDGYYDKVMRKLDYYE